ncbi:hypothetical protein VNO78_26399 [Psophocarpus tetragonolobus]|uniref:Uncharacterized protein n=1 Tax=Psophocarpus tetragonolobus TaxID=3891 RepID=A0AAN9X8X8_PSOTE
MMENKVCTCDSQPKKQRKSKYFGIRDFPEGCGPFASKIDSKTFGQSNETSLKLGMLDLEHKDLTSAAKVEGCDSSDVSDQFSSTRANLAPLEKAKRRTKRRAVHAFSHQRFSSFMWTICLYTTCG